jgi:hypothetical protein
MQIENNTGLANEIQLLTFDRPESSVMNDETQGNHLASCFLVVFVMWLLMRSLVRQVLTSTSLNVQNTYHLHFDSLTDIVKKNKRKNKFKGNIKMGKGKQVKS